LRVLHNNVAHQAFFASQSLGDSGLGDRTAAALSATGALEGDNLNLATPALEEGGEGVLALVASACEQCSRDFGSSVTVGAAAATLEGRVAMLAWLGRKGLDECRYGSFLSADTWASEASAPTRRGRHYDEEFLSTRTRFFNYFLEWPNLGKNLNFGVTVCSDGKFRAARTCYWLPYSITLTLQYGLRLAYTVFVCTVDKKGKWVTDD
jgi:hypothetical protein